MGMPSINIIFRELAKTFEQRNDNGIVALVLANNSGMNTKEYRPGDDLDASIAKDAKIQIQFAMEGGCLLYTSTKESLLMIITTAGMDLTYPCYTQEYDYCSKVLDSNIDVENDTYLIDIMEIDKGDDIGDEENWKNAHTIRIDAYKRQRER